MKGYKMLEIEILLMNEDIVRCSNIFEFGDDVQEDLFD